ncbi:MAG: diaminopimelate decarboxylase, partial [Nostocoides sp.]
HPAVWPRGARRGDDGVVRLAGVTVAELAETYGTPLFVVDEADFRARCAEYAAAFGAPERVHYASKAFLCSEIARWVAEQGLSLDVCSGTELAVARHAGFPAHRIAMHGNNKSEAELTAAVTAGVGAVVLDSFQEITRLDDLARRHGVAQPVLVRATVGVEAHTHEFIATGHEDQKFGFSLQSGQAAAAAEAILRRRSVLDLRGLHSHIGSQIFDTSGFELSARRLVQLHAEICRAHGIRMPEIDLGGGFGIAYTSQHTPLDPAHLGSQLADIVEREFTTVSDDRAQWPRVSIEPGRAIVGPSMFTLYEVGTIKEVDLGDGHARTYVSVDGGMSDNVRPALYEADYSCTLAGRRSDAPPRLSRVVGRHCESGDILVMDEYLPADLRRGDLIAVPGTGAYCRSLSSQYNHTPRPPVVSVRDGMVTTLLRRETIEDLLALDVG